MTKVEIFPIKICSRKVENPDEFETIMSVNFEPDEESFKQKETAPTISVRLTIESNKPEDIEYICGLNWFDHFFTHTGIHNLLRRVNFACNIEVNDQIEFSDEVKDKLNASFGGFVSKLRTIIDDMDKYVTMWSENPVFAVTMGTKDDAEMPTSEEAAPEDAPVEEVKDEPKSN